MKKTMCRFLPVIVAGMLFMNAGCAKHQAMKSDEPVAPPSANAAGSSQMSQSSSSAKTSEQPIAETNIKSSPPVIADQKKSDENNGTADTFGQNKMLETVYFEFDSSTLSDAARQALTRNFAVMKNNPQIRIRVEGHCDERGTDEYNLALGEHRAQTAVHYLTAMGVRADRLSTLSYGKEKPADQGHDEAAWSRNRRDEFIIAK